MGRDGSSASSASGLTEPSIWGPRLLLRCVLLAQTRDLPLVTQRHDLNPGLAPVASLPCAELCRGWTWRLVGRPRWTPSWRRGCGPEPAGVGTGDTPTRLCPPAREASVPGARSLAPTVPQQRSWRSSRARAHGHISEGWANWSNFSRKQQICIKALETIRPFPSNCTSRNLSSRNKNQGHHQSCHLTVGTA